MTERKRTYVTWETPTSKVLNIDRYWTSKILPLFHICRKFKLTINAPLILKPGILFFFRGQKGRGPLEKPQEMPHYMFCPRQKNNFQDFKNQRCIAIFMSQRERERERERDGGGEQERENERERARERARARAGRGERREERGERREERREKR